MIPLPPADILYEDNHLLIVNKKASQIIQGDKTGDPPLSELFKQFIRVRNQKPGGVFLGVIHRLDRPVSGAVIFAKTSKSLERMNKLLREGQISKIYWAIVAAKPDPPKNHLMNFLRKNEKQNKAYVFDESVTGSQKAELIYRLVQSSDRYHLLEIKLLTGRHHQIRAQLANIGCPIRGDLKYGFPRSNSDASISLHARKLEFTHPVSLENLTIIAPLPEDKLWSVFAEATASNG